MFEILSTEKREEKIDMDIKNSDIIYQIRNAKDARIEKGSAPELYEKNSDKDIGVILSENDECLVIEKYPDTITDSMNISEYTEKMKLIKKTGINAKIEVGGEIFEIKNAKRISIENCPYKEIEEKVATNGPPLNVIPIREDEYLLVEKYMETEVTNMNEKNDGSYMDEHGIVR